MKRIANRKIATVEKRPCANSRFDPFTLVVALVLLFIASILVFSNVSLSKKLFASGGEGKQGNDGIRTNFPVPVLQAGSPDPVEKNVLAFACVADLHAHGVQDAGRLAHCLAEYEQEKASRNKTYGEDCETHEQCPPSIVWTEDAHHGECPAGTGFKCSVRCTSGSDCSFKTGGVLSSCCFECSGGQPFGFCAG